MTRGKQHWSGVGELPIPKLQYLPLECFIRALRSRLLLNSAVILQVRISPQLIRDSDLFDECSKAFKSARP
jgi:hypothetical protein